MARQQPNDVLQQALRAPSLGLLHNLIGRRTLDIAKTWSLHRHNPCALECYLLNNFFFAAASSLSFD